MEIEYKTIENKNYFARFKTEFFSPVIVVTIISLISYKLTDLNFTLYIILGYSIVWAIITHFMVRNSINRIEINNGNILIQGKEIDTDWSESDKIENTSIRIKSQGFGRGNVEYYLKIYLSESNHIINKRKEWDYNDLIKIYNHISNDKYKNENKNLLEKMKLKAKGYSSFEIAFGKNNK
ncbi:hypothetical protein CJ739_3885 [Mariniflexile rhizosphaerae]|uniref:hypothetical protein n=1 Tax=unclassified Mariniflexile TaxID=2643887 RepID=UPI000E334B5D|nr:hypothetical protein [Mariniflexile sp. TRM1-10]AXP82944.1 hypothetical protein CJ739_3885 [Mariniflexile sp. TRM1-10]